MQVTNQQPVKAFDLLPVLDFSTSTGTPSCVSVAGNDIYVGYDTGHVRHFLLSSTTSNTRTKYQMRYLDEMIGSAKKTVTQILVAPTIARVIGLADNQVFVGDMFSMAGAQSYQRSTPKSVSYIAINEASNSYELEVAVCLSRKKTVLLMLVTAERFITKQEIHNLQGVPHKLSWSGSVLILAYDSYYSVYNMMSRTELELFPYNPTTTSPLFKTLSQGEFYMNGDGLGMIVNESGDVCRPPIVWVNQPKFVCYSNPYIVGISHSSIQVYSMLDQQLKQKSTFGDVSAAADFSGNVFIVTTDQIYMLLPVPAEEQVERLLDSGHLQQAMDLADETMGSLTRSTAKIFKLKQLRQKAGFMYFERGELTEAFVLFSKTQTPPSDIFPLYDTLAEDLASSQSKTSVSALEPSKQAEYHAVLLQYLSRTSSRTDDVNTQELKLLCLTDQSKIEQFIREKRTLVMKETVKFFKERRLFYYLGVFYAGYGFICEAIEQWKALELGDLVDESYPGLDCIIDLLLAEDIQAVIMGNIEWIIKTNPEKALDLLTNTSAELNYDAIVTMLSGKQAYVTRFLEHIVIVKNTDINRYHTHLAQQYLAVLLDSTTPKSVGLEIRQRLQRHLLRSDKYAVSLILNKIENTIFKKELAILYGKLKEHHKALSVLVYDLNDLDSAEEYCRQWPSGRPELHLLLLKLYLDCQTDQQDTLLSRAVDLLNNKKSIFNFSDVYEIIPKKWPISLIEPFVYRSLGYQAHQYRTTRIIKGLSELEWARVKSARAVFTKRLIRLSEGTYCSFCYHPFSDASCAISTTGEVYHPHCLKQIT